MHPARVKVRRLRIKKVSRSSRAATPIQLVMAYAGATLSHVRHSHLPTAGAGRHRPPVREHFFRNGHAVNLYVFDDSTPAMQQKYFSLLEETPTYNPLYYVGLRTRSTTWSWLSLCVTDGGKGLRTAIDDVLGDAALPEP